VLCYVDDVLSISADPKKTMLRIQNDFKLKDDKIAEPDMCLGATLAKMDIDGKTCWTMSPEQCVKAVVVNVEENLAKRGRRLPSECVTPFSCMSRWLETSAELKADGAQHFQELIGMLRWAVEIGRVDILCWRHRCCLCTLLCQGKDTSNKQHTSLMGVSRSIQNASWRLILCKAVSEV
jgi:hypothetical protein